MTTINEMAKLATFSNDWFNAAFENCEANEKVKNASRHICVLFDIKGQADPAYVANVIQDTLDDEAVEDKTQQAAERLCGAYSMNLNGIKTNTVKHILEQYLT